MVQASRTFRIFVSSTFSDLKEERNALQKKVFPGLRELCMQHGCRFQAIDLRWGVREEAALDQQTMRICQEEIARCQRITPRPHFIVLLGDRYGWRPLPFEIPANEFAEIEQRVSDTDKELLKKWYRRDDNAVPPVYCLQPRTGEFTDYTKWEIVERRLHSIMLQAIAEMNLTGDSYDKYTASATEQEIIQGLKAPDAGEHVFGFFRSIKEIPHNPSAKDFIDLDEMGNLDRDANKYLNDLKDRLLRLLPGNIYEYEAEWTGSGTTAEHIDRLCSDVYVSLSIIILKEIAKLEESDSIEKEIDDHIASGKERAKFFIGRTGILKTISEYVKGTDSHPLAVSGASGSGKSALMAHAAEKVRNEHKNAQAVVRFIGATPGSSDVRTLLESLCRQISRCYSADESTVPADYRDLIKDLPKRLALATAAKPLFLFLDALDQLSNADNARNLIWLPTELPAHVRLVISTLPGECLSTIEKKLPGANFAELEPMLPDEGAKLLDMWLDDAHRKLQEDQRAEILRKFELCGMPLYLRLAFGEAQRWKSYDGLPRGSKGHAGLSEDIPGIIRDMFWRLSQESNHGRMLVERSLGYLAASRNGLTEDEMLDVLSQDGELYQDFLKRTYHKPPEQRLPVVIWSRLYLDLEPYLTERSAEGTTLLAFYHRQLGEVVIGEYLVGESKRDRHRGLSQYFAVQSLWIEKENKKTPHLRKVSELPYQQTNGEMWPELEVTLTDLEFIEAKCTAGTTYDLVTDYNVALAAKGMPQKKRSIIGPFARFVRARSHVLVQRPDLLVQEAYNFAVSGTVAQRAKQVLNDTKHTHHPWLRRVNRPQHFERPVCLQILHGHTVAVKAVAVTPDGRRVVSGGGDTLPSCRGELKVWDIESGECLLTLEGHTDVVNAVSVSPDGHRAVSGSNDKTLRVWDLDSGECLRVLKGHTGFVEAIAITPDGKLVISAAPEITIADYVRLVDTLRVWDLESGMCLKVLRVSSITTTIELTSHGRQVIMGHTDGRLELWDFEKEERLRTLKGDGIYIRALAVTPNGRLAISGSGQLQVCDLDTGVRFRFLSGHKGIVNSLAVTPDGMKAVSGSMDSTLCVWSLEESKRVSNDDAERQSTCLRILEGHTDSVNAVAVTPDARRAVSGSDDRTVRVWDLETEDDVANRDGHLNEVLVVVVTPDGQQAISVDAIRQPDFDIMNIMRGSRDSFLRVWNIESGKCLRTVPTHQFAVRTLAVTPDGRYAISGGIDPHLTEFLSPCPLKVWNLENGKCLWELEGHGTTVSAVAATPDGKYVISSSEDGTLRLWDLRRRAYIRTLESSSSVHVMAITPDGRKVVAGCEDGTLWFWDLESGNCQHTPPHHTGSVGALAVTPDGRLVISGGNDKVLVIWNLESGKFLRILKGQEDNVSAIGVTPDGCRVVSSAKDGRLRVWELRDGNYLWTLQGHSRSVDTFAITPDGRHLISGSADKTLSVWDLETGKELAHFVADGDISSCAVEPKNTRIISGDKGGNVYFLVLENVAPDPPIITAWRSPMHTGYAFGCSLCRTWSEIPASALGTEIPCPHCGKPIKLNPFTINADWQQVAKAWRGGKD